MVQVMLLGLCIAQGLATIQVYLSNSELHHNVELIRNAGYLAIPNQRIMHTLQEFGPAFFGALFFTLSVGTGLTLLSFAAAWAWDRIFGRGKPFLVILLLVWIACLAGVNRRGFCLMPTLHFLVIPIAVWWAALRLMPRQAKQGVWVNRMVNLIPVVLLAALWTTQMDKYLFLDIRDHLLLSNSIGRKVNNFYYNYTLYPAEVFKSLNQKLIKTCNLESIKQKSIVPSLERRLLNHDYLIVTGAERVNLRISQTHDILILENERRAVMAVPVKDFVSRPGDILEKFSVKSDMYGFFRKFTFFSFLIGFPITLYVVLYASFLLALRRFLASMASSVIASLLCFLLGIALLGHLHYSRGKTIEVDALADTLESERWQDRVAALKTIAEKGIEVAGFSVYKQMLKSPSIPERYWLARVLGISRRPQTYRELLAFLDDPHPNVVSMALSALGQRGDRRAVREIRRRIETSNNWYNQWYAYKALRALGWKQSKLR